MMSSRLFRKYPSPAWAGRFTAFGTPAACAAPAVRAFSTRR
ncbi:Uncharacterised protein [Mycobacterium tuberculosis]|nr:Uncharacterised protein [Mycobacterium tuberculosis]